MKTCNECNISQDEIEFYVKDRKTGRLSNKCRTCEAIKHGIIFIGKNKYHKDLRENGLIKCSDCQEVKTMENYHTSNTKQFGYSQVCKKCCLIRHRRYMEVAKEKLTPSYLKQYLKLHYGIDIKNITPELLEIAELEIKIKREPKYFLDGKSFITLRDFAVYVMDNDSAQTIDDAKKYKFAYTKSYGYEDTKKAIEDINEKIHDEIDKKSYENYLKMERENAHFESTIQEKRKKDKEFGKVIKNYKKEMKKNKF